MQLINLGRVMESNKRPRGSTFNGAWGSPTTCFAAGSVRSQISAVSPIDFSRTLGCMVFVWALKKVWCIVSFPKMIYRSLVPQN